MARRDLFQSHLLKQAVLVVGVFCALGIGDFGVDRCGGSTSYLSRMVRDSARAKPIVLGSPFLHKAGVPPVPSAALVRENVESWRPGSCSGSSRVLVAGHSAFEKLRDPGVRVGNGVVRVPPSSVRILDRALLVEARNSFVEAGLRAVRVSRNRVSSPVETVRRDVLSVDERLGEGIPAGKVSVIGSSLGSPFHCYVGSFFC